MDSNKNILQIPIEEILPNRFQPRLAFDSAALNELAASIKEHGIIQPLVVRKLANKYEIIAGERRYRAAKLAGLLTVPVILTEMSDKKSAEVAIVENIQRKDLSAIEEARSYKALLDKGVLNQEELARKMGLSQSAISNKLRLLALSKEVQDAILNEKISERHARSLLKIKDEEKQNEYLNKIINERLTVKQLEESIKKFNETLPDPAFEVKIVEEKEAKEEEIIKLVQEDEPLFKIPGLAKKEYPNKFFNFLENESANMTNDIEVTEEIEMLDLFEEDSTITNIKDLLKQIPNLEYEEAFENGKKVLKIKIPN